MDRNVVAVRGTRDFYPEDMRVINYIFAVWRNIALTYGFEEYDGPAMEHLELYTRKSGEEIVNQLYYFKDKSERELALRPEITPTLARMINQKGPQIKRPIKWFSIPRLFRYERSMRGRLREFFQLNMDIIGVDDVSADAEIISALIHLLKAFKLKESDFCVHISSRQLYNVLLCSLGYGEKDITGLYYVLDKRDKMESGEYREFFLSKGFKEDDLKRTEEIFNSGDLNSIRMPSDAEKPLDDLKKLFELLWSYGFSEYVSFTPSVVRGLAYYTGIVFEVFDRERKLRAIAGGGRFDNLLESLGGESLPAVGFGMGDAVLFELLKEKNLLPCLSKQIDVYVVGIEPCKTQDIIKVVALLRGKGLSTEFSLRPQSVKKQMGMASQNKSRHVVFIGGDEAERGLVRIKDMKNGKEDILSFEKAVEIMLRNVSVL